jgi:uncharacterized protein YdiU (UPF0061 family)
MSTPFAQLPWKSRFVSTFPGDSESANFTRQVKNALYSKVHPTEVPEPKLIAWSNSLAEELGIKKPNREDEKSLNALAGNEVAPGMVPYAARYGGHQFGNWAGQLGDGRAITLGEAEVRNHSMLEFQLKGAGPTPYSRRADGRAVLRSSIREFLCSEAMHALGVPTTRALSLVHTGDDVIRDMFYDGNSRAEPGAIVCRVSPSFLRFGNFEILAHQQEHDLLKKLADDLIKTHFPEIEKMRDDEPDVEIYAILLDEICGKTAVMIAHWMRVGFVHGVMNTDNMSVLGITIDYGPYGWVDNFDPNWTPNTTDAENGRYRYGHQPNIALWNLARFAEALFPLIQNEARIHEALGLYRSTFEKTYGEMLAQKLGFKELLPSDQGLVESLFENLQKTETDFAIFFRALSNLKPGDDLVEKIKPAFYSETISPEITEAWQKWSSRYEGRLKSEGLSFEVRSTAMKKTNPKYVLRNYLSQNAIKAAEAGDYSQIERLLRVMEKPYDEQPGEEELAGRRPEWARNSPGCSALSCSS